MLTPRLWRAVPVLEMGGATGHVEGGNSGAQGRTCQVGDMEEAAVELVGVAGYRGQPWS